MEPIKPVTPPNSPAWRIVHFPPVLLVIGIIFMMGAGFTSKSLGYVISQAGSGRAELLVAITIAAVFLGYYWALVRWVERRPEVSELKFAGLAKELGAGLLTGLLLFSSVAGLIAVFGGYRVIGTNEIGVLVPVLAMSITSGVTEELMLRGIFFRLLESWVGSWIALVSSAILFGALHLANPHASLLAGAAITVEAGLMLAALYMLTRRLWIAIGVHAAWNFTEGGIYGTPVSGIRYDGILISRTQGPDLLTGGSFGPEVSLPAVIVCTAFGIVLLILASRRGLIVKPAWVRKRQAQPAGLQE